MNKKLLNIIINSKNEIPFFKDSFREIEISENMDLSLLPVIDPSVYWKSNNVNLKLKSGLVFKSGGSTGAPKYSYFTHAEWREFTRAFGIGMSKGILEDNDRVANLFYAGDLYASFLFIKDSLEAIESLRISQFPIGGATSFDSILKTLEEFDINVVCGVPSQLISLFEYYVENRIKYPKVKLQKILFGGEALYEDQIKTFITVFPNLKISSIGCASVDGGLIGYSSKDCRNFEHRVFSDDIVLEIVDPDTLELIKEMNRVGKIYITNLNRQLMPIIRYPSGDMGMWLEDENTKDRKFKFCGRAEESARVGTLSVYVDDIREMVLKEFKEINILQLQLIINHFENKDQLIIRLHGINSVNTVKDCELILNRFSFEKKNYQELVDLNLIHPIKIELVDIDKLEFNQRTGKLKRVVDNRIKR